MTNDHLNQEQMQIRLPWVTEVSILEPYPELVDLQNVGNRLVVTICCLDNGAERSFKFTWQKFCAYFTIDEAQAGRLGQDSPSLGKFKTTYKIENSAWLADLRKGNDLLDMYHPGAEHFVICTCDFVIEVISNAQPEVTEVN